MTISAILFDFDGTISDSERFHFNCWNETLADCDVILDWDFYITEFAGIPTPQTAQLITEKYHLSVTPDVLATQRAKIVQHNAKTHTPVLMPYAEQVIQHYYDKGLKLAIVTGSPRSDIDNFFQKINFAHYFDAVVTRTDVNNSKPDPESYLLALQQLNITAEKAIVFEDTQNGIASAVGANLVCIAVQPHVNLHHKLTKANAVFTGLQQAQTFVDGNFLLKKSN